MFFSEAWLRRYIDPQLDTIGLAQTLTMAGLEVEEVVPVAPPFTGVVVGHVLTCRRHENSDHLHVAEVDIGSGAPLQIVCGAPNVRAGLKVACATVGAELPGGFRIKRARMRGVDSVGMLCSERELGVSEDHSGIWELPAGAVVGQDVRQAMGLDDHRFEVKLTPNRGDALSLVGLARDLHAVTGVPLSLPAMPEVTATAADRLAVRIEEPELCGRFCGRVIRGVNALAPTPDWMKERLIRSGQRPISALVDISNYVMLELGRPTHFFDLDKIQGELRVRWAREGESCLLLNGQDVKLDPYFGVICDDRGPQAIAGIMGGEATAISESTVNIFVEAAFWYPTQVQGRCRRLNFSSDAAHRFERGVDYGSNLEHMHYITRLVLDICGTERTTVGPADDQIVNLPETRRVGLRAARCRKIVGADISADFIAQAFQRLGFAFERDGDDFTVTVPSYRFDIEIEADLIEEVARLFGYENLPDRPPLAPATMRARAEGKRGHHDLRLKLAGRGYQELINFSFVERAWEKDFAGNDRPIALLNPIISQLAVMRTQLISGLVDILRFNLNRKTEEARLFELGRVFFPDDSVGSGDLTVKGVRQPEHIAGLIYGQARGLQWGEPSREADFYDVKGDVEYLASPLKVDFEPSRHPALHPGRSARVLLDGEEIGFLGELHPRLCQSYGLPKAPVVFELDAEKLYRLPLPSPRPVSKHQPTLFDISVTAPAEVTAARMMAAIDAVRRGPAGEAIAEVRLFDVYRPADGGDRSFAFRLTLSSHDDSQPLTEEGISAAVSAVVTALNELGCRLRS